MNEERENSNQQGYEFEILGIKLKWRAPVIFGIVSLSVLLNIFLVYKVMSIQNELYERVITEIKEPLQKIDKNIKEANKKLSDNEDEGGNNDEQ